jgi:amino acid transporter
MSMHAAPARAGTVSRALARDKLGMFAVLAFILASIAPMTVAAGVIPTAYALTGLAGIPAAFLVVAVVLALFCPGYVAMSRRIRNAGALCLRLRRARQGDRGRRRADGPGRV